MKKLTQSKLHKPDEGQQGNCMMTCYASFLHLDLVQVPPIEQLFDTKIPTNFWWTTLLNWFKLIGCELSNGDTDPYLNPKDWGLDKPWTDYYFTSGVSPRDKSIHHLVIFKKGKLFWDVHPDRTGIKTKSNFDIIRIVDPGKLSRFQTT